MRGQLIKISALTALATALVVSATMLYAGPKLGLGTAPSAQYSAQVNDSAMQAAVYHPRGDNQVTSGYQPVMFATRRRVYYDANGNVIRTSTGEPVVHRRRRSKKKSALIIAGSAATGAAIGGIAKGGKGAAIGALVGGGTGLVYDRATVNKKQ